MNALLAYLFFFPRLRRSVPGVAVPMSANYYPACAPPWFLVYSVSSAHYDSVAAAWWYLALGSRNGDKATFRQYLFMLGSPYTAAVEYPIGIPVVHAVFTQPVNNRIYIYGQSERDVFWQDGPLLAQTKTQQTIARFVKPSPVPFKVLSRAQHDFLPVRDPDLWDREWKRWAA